MKIALTSVFVEDQARALDFYTRCLGLQLKCDIPFGELRYLTVVAARAEGMELLLEPNVHAAVRTFQSATRADGIPSASLSTDDMIGEVARMEALGVEFTTPPTAMGDVMIAVFDDTCGNLIQLVQE